MLDKINIQINNKKEQVAKKKVLEKKLEELKKDLCISEEELSQLESNLRKEKRDVDNLKKLSLSNFMSTIKGNKEEMIEKEEKEFLMAKLKYDNFKLKLDSIKYDIKDTKERLKILSDCEEEYTKLLKEKIKLLNIYGDENTKNKIMKIEAKIDSYLKEIKEIDESVSVGNNLMSEIVEAKRLLESAKNWSTFDLFGGDLLTSMAKHSKIDDAQIHFSKISNLVRSFNKELGDVNINGVGFSSTTKTFDIFFDNIFTDLSVDRHINESYNEVCSLERSVDSILKSLKNNKIKLNSKISFEKNEYDEFIKSI